MEWIVRLTLILLGVATSAILITSGCSHKLGTMEIDTDGSFSGLMYKNCGCGCTAIVDLDADDPFTSQGKEPIEGKTDVDVRINLPK